MRWRTGWRCLGVALLAAPLVLASVPARAEDRLALIIANGTYPAADKPREAAETDAGSLDATLSADGFETRQELNLDWKAMRAALDAFLAKITPGATALVYFNGFGLQVRGQTYLLPTDAEIWSAQDVAEHGVNLATLLADMGKRGAKVKIAVIDAARANPFEKRFRDKPLGLAPLALPPNTLVIANAEPGALGADDAPFMDKLVDAMDDRALNATQAFNQARLAVARATKMRQAPWVASSLTARFAFAAPPESGQEVGKTGRRGRQYCFNRLTGRFLHWGACGGYAAHRPYYKPYYYRRRSWTPDADEPAGPAPPPDLKAGSATPPSEDREPTKSAQPVPQSPKADDTPRFPWPPPAPSTSYQIPNGLFGKAPTMGGVAETITRALERAGYAERRYYALPIRGIALATRLERCNIDGSPGAPRWQTKEEKGLLDLLRGLFFTEPGHYRVIVFLVTRKPPGRTSDDVPIEEAKGWLKGGLDVVPKEAGAAPYGDGTTLAYIYDFVSDGQKFMLDREPLPGKEQLSRAGVLTALEADGH